MRLAPVALLVTASLARGESLDAWRQTSVVELKATLHHVQGIDTDGRSLWVSSVWKEQRKGFLSKFDLRTGALLARVEVQSGDRFHPGGIALDGRHSLWMPVAEYDRDGPATIERRDSRTLRLLSSFEVADHIGCVAAGRGGLVGGNWDSRVLYRWTRDGKQLSRAANPGKTSYQDLKIAGARLVGSGVLSKESGAIEWLDLDTYAPIRRVETGVTSRGVPYSNEGMAIRGSKLYLLPEDDPSRLFVFARR